ncbi:MAG: PD40 domain-containing protein [candidate division Zixibacteria bacterium]|nr:PD40 domain-containing protein [candidate division Zixibacteria bacterium]
MRIFTTTLTALLLCFIAFAGAQETFFGKNKVQYRNFDWNYIQTDHFDVYFYDNEYDLAKFAAEELEEAYVIVTDQLNYFVSRRIPVFVYSSHNDFQQTNIISSELSEGTQGFTEVFKNRMVVHFMGSYEAFRHLLHHELTHAVIFDMLYGQFFKSLISSSRLFVQPLWLAEGFAEYSSNGGWASEADMIVRDATINGYMRPPGYMGQLAYTEGFAMVKYIVDNYGIEKPGEILKRGKALISIDKALKSSIGLTVEELYDKFSKEMKRRYWPDIAQRQEPKEIAKQLTKHGEDGSFFNEKPVFSPDGKTLAMFTNINGYTEIYLISPIDGKKIARLVKGERNAELESLRWYTSGISFSPDSKNIVFVSKSKGEDALNFFRIKGRDIYLKKKFGLKSIISPAWSPNGKYVAFTALLGAQRNLYLYNLESDEVRQLTNDVYDDTDVAWYPDNTRLIFSSDRPHPENDLVIKEDAIVFGVYNLHELNTETSTVSPVLVGPGPNREPVITQNGRKIAFTSGRNGIDNLYVYYIDSSRTIAVTNALTNAKSPTWDANGEKLAFSTFFYGGYDIFLMTEVSQKGDNGVLPVTDFVLGKYDNSIEWARPALEGDHVEENSKLAQVETPIDDPDFPKDNGEVESEFAPGKADDKIIALSPEDKNEDSVEPSVEDSTVSDSTEAEEVPSVDPEEDLYVYRAPKSESVFDPQGSVISETGEESFIDEKAVDSLATVALDNRHPSGEYKTKPYKTKFTPDIISGGLQYDTFFGFRGQTVFLFSDYLGDHEIVIATDLVNTIDQSNIQLSYLYKRHRINYGVGLFHTKNFYQNALNEVFSDRFYGMMGMMSMPQSKFTRFDLSTALYFVDRKNYDTEEKSNVRISTGSFSWTHDTVLWGITGPVKGRRFKITTEGAIPVFGAESVEYYSGELDYRQYFPLGRPFTFAFRYSGGFSNGAFPKNYYLGGNVNKIGSISVDNSVYNVENLYFSSIVTPLRGYDYYDFVGTRYSVVNMELRFPFIDYFIMRYPLRLGLSRVTGALFLDMGATWNESDTSFKGGASEGGNRLVGIKSGFGFGARANLGFLVLRYDMAWRTDFKSVEPHTKHYFSLGADF